MNSSLSVADDGSSSVQDAGESNSVGEDAEVQADDGDAEMPEPDSNTTEELNQHFEAMNFDISEFACFIHYLILTI